MNEKPCRVPWCTAARTTDSSFCPVHVKRPAYNDETANQWRHRLGVEDRAAKKAAERAAEEAEEAAIKAAIEAQLS